MDENEIREIPEGARETLKRFKQKYPNDILVWIKPRMNKKAMFAQKSTSQIELL